MYQITPSRCVIRKANTSCECECVFLGLWFVSHSHGRFSAHSELRISVVLHQCAEIEEHNGDQPNIKTEGVEIPKPTKKEEKRKRRERRRRRSKRKILGELGLGFDKSSDYYKLDYGFGMFNDDEARGYGMFGSQRQHQVKMPPLNDGMAMKEHLKSWAYAVASTVR
ncbi:hypothetical protein D5086_008210 [Populus alba]|uniref:Uncharacterized protein n=1 Tax=Populus alba TaxID=43335 RepID=A0ACC4CER8_POPAL